MGTSITAVKYARLTQSPLEMLVAQMYGEEPAEAKAASAFIDEATILELQFEGFR